MILQFADSALVDSPLVDMTADTAFADLGYADEQWLVSEFEAIVAANWPAPPSRVPPQRREPNRGNADDRAGERAGAVPAPGSSRSTSASRRRAGAPLRQRSPPRP